LLAQFETDNDAAYNIYYCITNPNGKVTSEVKKLSVEKVEISSIDDFYKLAVNGGDSNKIYSLTQDLDFSSYQWAIPSSSQGFKGLLNGNGYTIKNLSITATAAIKASIFTGLKGGTIMNVNFENISLKNSGNKVGIIGEAYSGYLYNIKMKNIYASGQERVGALIGQALEGDTPLYIDKIELINTSEDYSIVASSKRSGGLIGLIQPTSGATNGINVQISNCYVKATIGSSLGSETGGIVGTYDTQKTTITFNLEITNCYFAGTAIANNKCGGIIGNQQGSGKAVVTNCINIGDIYHAGSTSPIVTAEKNASGIFGGYVSNADVTVSNCYAKFEEHNVYYGVETYISGFLSLDVYWGSIYLRYDTDTIWEFVYDSNGKIVDPYVRLR
jgi:hypothetical protein